ncbi:MAG: SUMF1/EgtB/PvdO family nonheme iron enzyme [Gammaproteobacteria bacterium]|nr:SUMF1/EgtB/PvdO family nonheme iron enzyme [Gammaproteobacteria bacterium]
MEPEIRKIGKYDILSILGKGAMGTIYKGVDPFIRRHVAIKTISTHIPSVEQQVLKERFIREAQAAGRLQHLNIVGIYEYGEDSNQAFIAMEFVQGVTLTDKLLSHNPFEIQEVCDIMSKVLGALDYAHSMGVIHRDIKPGNIILTDNGVVKVTDFGIARLESSTMTQVGTVLGTPGYMSPEQLIGEHVDNRSDIFSAGALFYELLTGKKAFGGSTFPSVMYKVLNAEPTPPASLNPTVPIVFDEIVAKSLAKQVEQRYQTAREFMSDINDVASQLASGAITIGRTEPLPVDKTIIKADGPTTPENGDDEDDEDGFEWFDPAQARTQQTESDATWIPRPPPKRRRGRNAAILVGLILIIGLIFGGWQYFEEHEGNSSRSTDSVRGGKNEEVGDRPLSPGTGQSTAALSAPSPHDQKAETTGELGNEGKAASLSTPESPTESRFDKEAPKEKNNNQVYPGAGRMSDIASVSATNDKTAAPPEAITNTYRPGQLLKDCNQCPELVVIAPGSFIRGSPTTDSERLPGESPQHNVSISYSMAVGRYEVTLEEFEAFTKDTGHRASGCTVYNKTWVSEKDKSWKNPGYEQSGQHPATCIAWDDTQAYTKWLSEKTGQTYRLLSSSEWEYVARAGNPAPRPWGDNSTQACVYGNVADTTAEQQYNGWKVHDCRDRFIHTAPVGTFQPNGFSVYDTLGNAFEWVEDCWTEGYEGVPVDGSPQTAGNCSNRILRGGSWFSMPRFVRPAFRNHFKPDSRSSTFGFRVARVLD